MSIFSRKHYEAIAEFLCFQEACDVEVFSWCDFFKKDNPNFSEKLFTKRAMAYAKEDEEDAN